MTSRPSDYEPGTVALATVRGVPNVQAFRLSPERWVTPEVIKGTRVHPIYNVTDVRPLVVLDLHVKKLQEFAVWLRCRSLTDDSVVAQIADQIEAQTVPPKTYRVHSSMRSPWPEVAECHSYDVVGHECPQCAWAHEHDWVAWTTGETELGGIPIRCSKCGARKCDQDDCDQQRHTHTHNGEARG